MLVTIVCSDKMLFKSNLYLEMIVSGFEVQPKDLGFWFDLGNQMRLYFDLSSLEELEKLLAVLQQIKEKEETDRVE